MSFTALATAAVCAILAVAIFVFAWLLGRPGNGRRRVGAPLPAEPPRAPLADLPRDRIAEATQEFRVVFPAAPVHTPQPVDGSETTVNTPLPWPAMRETTPPNITWRGVHHGATANPAHTPHWAVTARLPVAPGPDRDADTEQVAKISQEAGT